MPLRGRPNEAEAASAKFELGDGGVNSPFAKNIAAARARLNSADAL